MLEHLGVVTPGMLASARAYAIAAQRSRNGEVPIVKRNKPLPRRGPRHTTQRTATSSSH